MEIDILVDSWYAKYLTYKGCAFDSWVESQKLLSYVKPLIARSGLFRGILLYISARKRYGIVLVCSDKGFWVFLILKALLNPPVKCIVLEFIRREPLDTIKKLVYPFLLHVVIIPVVRKSVSKAQVMTLWEKNRYEDLFGITNDTFVYIPFPMNRPEKLSKINRNKDVIMSSGRVSCDWETLVETARLMPQYKFIIVHSKKDDRRLSRSNIPTNCELLCNITQTEHNRLLESATCYVVTLLETFGSSAHVRLSHAVHLEIPAIITDVMAIREYVIDNETAILVPQRDVMALKSAIRRLVNDEVLQKYIAQRAKERSRRWTREQYYQKISDVIDQTIR